MGYLFLTGSQEWEIGNSLLNPGALVGGEAPEYFIGQAAPVGVDFGVDVDVPGQHQVNGGEEGGGLATFEFIGQAACACLQHIKHFAAPVFVGREQHHAQKRV